MAAPTPVPGLASPVSSAAEDTTYKTTMAQIEHGEGNLIGNAYGATGEIAGELGQQIANVNERIGREVGPNYATKGELGGSLGLGLNNRTRMLSGRAGANIQSGIYGNERANAILGFTQRAQGVEQGGREARERIQDRARKEWEKDQLARSTAATRANERYLNNVLKNPQAGAITAAGGGPPGTRVTAGPGSPGQPIQAGFGNMGGPVPVGGTQALNRVPKPGPFVVKVGGPPRRRLSQEGR